jgi:hypothetical protein
MFAGFPAPAAFDLGDESPDGGASNGRVRIRQLAQAVKKPVGNFRGLVFRRIAASGRISRACQLACECIALFLGRHHFLDQLGRIGHADGRNKPLHLLV